MYTLLVFVAAVVAIFLVISVLMQSSKGGGLAGTFGGSGNLGSMFGTRRTADFLSKATWWLAGSLVVLILVINLFFLPGQMSAGGRESVIQRSRQTVPTTPAVPQQRQQQAPTKR